MKKVLAVFMSVLMLMQLGTMSQASDFSGKLDKNEWEAYYNSLIDDNTLPMLNVGADETQVSLCWHADKDTAKAQVKLSKSADMSDAVLLKERRLLRKMIFSLCAV